MTTLAIRMLLAVAFLSAFLTYFKPTPPKLPQQYCLAVPTGMWFPCEWVPEEREA